MIKLGIGLIVGVNVGLLIGYGHPHVVDEALIKIYGFDAQKVKQFRDENAYGKRWEKKAEEATS